MRVALITNVLAQYRVPCFQRLAERLPGQVTFFVLAENMEHRRFILADRQNGLTIFPLRGWRWHRPPQDDIHLNDIRPVVSGDYDIVILGGWDEPTYFLLWAWGMIHQKHVIFWVESTSLDRPRKGIKEKYKKLLLSRAAGCVVPGRKAFQYCRQLGQSGDSIFTIPNATDRLFFRGEADRLLPLRGRLREEQGLRDFSVLFAGRLVEELKGISTLIKACGQLERDGKTVSLLIAGDGPEKKSYQDLSRNEGPRDVRFLGMLNHETLCRYYASTDVFVLPSKSEPWGFVLNEAMEFGLPLVISEAVGAGPDLVRDGENGFVFPLGDAQALAGSLEALAADEALRRRMGEISRKRIEHFSPEHWAEGVMRAIEAVSNGSGCEPHS